MFTKLDVRFMILIFFEYYKTLYQYGRQYLNIQSYSSHVYICVFVLNMYDKKQQYVCTDSYVCMYVLNIQYAYSSSRSNTVVSEYLCIMM